MRVVAGTHRGRRLVAPKGDRTRPTSDRVREAVFSRLEAAGLADGGSVLDLFAGSGALGIEALSRGAAHVTFVERDRAALAALRSNLDALGVTGCSTVIAGDALSVPVRGRVPGAPFSLLFLDPPYRIDKSEVSDAVVRLATGGALADGALLVWEHASADKVTWPPALDDLGARRYGDTTVSIARLSKGETG
jgi:16S rRNA (guanine966-N2)-methyltransferase